MKITKNGEKQVKESVKVAKQTVTAFEAICTEGSDAKIHVVRGRRGRGAAEVPPRLQKISLLGGLGCG